MKHMPHDTREHPTCMLGIISHDFLPLRKLSTFVKEPQYIEQLVVLRVSEGGKEVCSALLIGDINDYDI